MHSSTARRWRLAALLATLGTTSASAVDERPIAEPRLPRLTCYSGYLKLEAPHGLEAVLDAFRKSFPQEKNECVRWAIVRYAVRAAGARALPLLKDFAQQDARFRQDHTEFKALYDAGQVDFDRVFPGKAHHHRCEDPEE